MNLLYLTDVFCPWCYGFAPVMRRLAAEHPELPVRVLGGNLMDEPQTLTGMLEEYPTIREFFARLQETTGQSTEHFRQALEQAVAGTGPDLLMHSPAMNLPLAALRHLAPGHELEQMEAFQMAFYAQGRDVMAAGEQAAIAAAWLPAGTPADALAAAMAAPAIRSAARHDAAEAEEVMGEFLLYPTLYLEHDGQRTLLARGYSDYANLRAFPTRRSSDLPGCHRGRLAACGLD
uniref:DsbA family protein n=1 Tax=Desulfovibrio piger TaxID=901 RepID=UPI0026EB6198